MEKEKRLDSIPKLLRSNYDRHPDKVALREKDRGIWKCITWRDYYEKVKYFSLGLKSLGFKEGDKTAILGENKPEWYYAELATQAIGGIAVGIFTDCSPSEVKFYIQHSDSAFVVVQDQEQVDKLLQIKNELPFVKKVIYWDTKGLWSYSDPILLDFDGVFELGQKYAARNPRFFDQKVDQGRADDIAVILYTSGTTGLPKGSMFSHRFLLGTLEGWSKRDNWQDKGYNYLSFIPPAWGIEQIIGIAGSLHSGLTVNFPEKPEMVQENLREIGPEILFYGARLWELVNRTNQAKIMDTTFPRQLIYRMCLPVGLKMADLRVKKHKVNLLWKSLYFLAYHAVFRQLRDKLGFSNVKVTYSAGAGLSPDIIRFFLSLGVEIKLWYGSTEMGIVSSPLSGEIRPETSGPIVPWAKVKISEEGEILVKSKYMYSGYYKNIEATKEKLQDGWYKTGDCGFLDKEGHLIVIDRMADLKSLSKGKKFSPQYVETRLRFSPYIKDILTVGGEEKDYVVALINIDMENVGLFAEKNRIPYTTFVDLSQKPAVIGLVRGEVAKVNKTLPSYAQVKKFVNLYKELDADESELTRTRKLRRDFVENRYRDVIEAIYGEREEYEVETIITYRDGRIGKTRVTIRVTNVEEAKK